MKHLSWFLGAFFIVVFVGGAYAQFPRPQSSGSAVQSEPLRPIVNVAPAQVTVPAPVVNFTAPPASTLDEIKSWLLVTFSGLIAALLAKIGFRPAASRVIPVEASAGSELPAEASVLLKLRDKVLDPDFKAKIDTALLAAVSTGIPGKLTQTGLSAIPVAGPLVGSFAQPLLEEAFVNFLKSRLESNSGASKQ